MRQGSLCGMLRGASSKGHMQRGGGLVKRAIFLATAALLAMLILVPMAWAQGGTTHFDYPITTGGSPTPVPIPDGGGPAILLPAVALLVGSGILTYAIL